MMTGARSQLCRPKTIAWNGSCSATRRACRSCRVGEPRTRTIWTRRTSETATAEASRWTIATSSCIISISISIKAAAAEEAAAVRSTTTELRCNPRSLSVRTDTRWPSIINTTINSSIRRTIKSTITTLCRNRPSSTITTTHEVGCRSTRPTTTATVTCRTTGTRTAAAARPRGRRWPATRSLQCSKRPKGVSASYSTTTTTTPCERAKKCFKKKTAFKFKCFIYLLPIRQLV